jgi:hypothetical protein
MLLSKDLQKKAEEIETYCDNMLETSIVRLHLQLTTNAQIQALNILADNSFDATAFLASDQANDVMLHNFLKQNHIKMVNATAEMKTYLNMKAILHELKGDPQPISKEIPINE